MKLSGKYLPPVAIIIACLVVLGSTSLTMCGDSKKKPETTVEQPKLKMKVPYSSDSAYAYIKAQVDLGPRVPGTEANRKCGDFIISKLKEFGADSIITQEFTTKAFTGDKLPLRNIMGRFSGGASDDRILLIAHYDTRPWADRDKNNERRNEPILGANDGGSGVGTLLAIASQFAQQRPDVGVDMLFVDGEDYGHASEWDNNDSTWCLGSQYWVKNQPEDYAVRPPRFGILLDMVGARNARFPREFISERYAENIVDKVWGIAAASGHSRFFVNQRGGSVIDDHYFINQANIPTVDIIDINNAETNSFPPTWHTHSDNLDNISRATLRYVGRTVSNVIYYEKP